MSSLPKQTSSVIPQKPKASKHVTILPKVANMMNSCRSKQIECRVIMDSDKQTIEDVKRMTIVVKENGDFVSQYWG